MRIMFYTSNTEGNLEIPDQFSASAPGAHDLAPARGDLSSHEAEMISGMAE